jgi:hypothetical protein
MSQRVVEREKKEADTDRCVIEVNEAKSHSPEEKSGSGDCDVILPDSNEKFTKMADPVNRFYSGSSSKGKQPFPQFVGFRLDFQRRREIRNGLSA